MLQLVTLSPLAVAGAPAAVVTPELEMSLPPEPMGVEEEVASGAASPKQKWVEEAAAGVAALEQVGVVPMQRPS